MANMGQSIKSGRETHSESIMGSRSQRQIAWSPYNTMNFTAAKLIENVHDFLFTNLKSFTKCLVFRESGMV